MNKKQKILTIITLLLVSSGLFALYQYENSYQRIGVIHEENPTPIRKVKFCDIPPQYPLAENSTLQTVPWITYHNKELHYQFDYPSILVSSRDTLPPAVTFDNLPLGIYVGFTSTDSYPYQRSLDAYIQHLNLTIGDRLEKRIKIDGYDAIVTSFLSERKDETDAFVTFFIKDKKFFGIRTQCVDHERVWNSFKFE